MPAQRRRDLTIIAATITAIAAIAVVVVVIGGGDDAPPSASPPGAAPPASKPPSDAARAAAIKSIERNALAYQRALDPTSSDDPCRYMTTDARREVLFSSDGRRSCGQVLRHLEAAETPPLYQVKPGVTHLQFLPRVETSGLGQAPPGAEITWDGDRTRTESFVHVGNDWLIGDYKSHFEGAQPGG